MSLWGRDEKELCGAGEGTDHGCRTVVVGAADLDTLRSEGVEFGIEGIGRGTDYEFRG